MRLGGREFSPRLWAIMLYLLVLSCMLWLGNWQMQRAALKVDMRTAAQAASSAPAIPVAAVSDIDTAATRYKRVHVQGVYDEKRQFLWDNRTHKGAAGYEVIVPMALSDGRWALVNRGWISSGLSRDVLPDISLPQEAIQQAVAIEGFLSLPSKGFASGEALVTGDQWPKRLQFLDYQSMAEALNETVIPTLIQSQSLSPDGKTPTVPTPRPEWLIANWQPAASGPAKHYSYAFQWFAMAVALSVIFVFVNARKVVENDVESSQ